jgi:HK97 family phage major capsid protein
MRTLDEIAARSAEIAAELAALDAVPEWSDEQRISFDGLEAELSALKADKDAHEKRAKVRAAAGDLARTDPIGEAPTFYVKKTGDPYDLRTLSLASGPNDIRARAAAAIEATPELDDSAKEQATKIARSMPAEVGRRILLTGSTAYRTAYQKGMVGQSALWSDEERDAFRAALSLTDGNGGYAVPFVLDPSIISTKDVSTNPFRRIGRTVTTTGDNWQGLSSAGVTASFDAEAAEVSDDSPTLAQPAIAVHMARAFVRGSIEISMDWAGIEAELRGMFQEAKDDLEASVMATGTGSGQPVGIVTAIAGTASEINAATDDIFAIGDVYTLEAALPPKYRLAVLDGSMQTSRASWVANHAIYNKIRQFDTQGGAGLWETLGAGLPARLLGYPAYEASDMDGVINTSGAVSNFVLLIGDFRHYVIVDRVGLNVEFIPHLFHTSNNLPSGQRGWFAYWRVGADSVNDDAFRLLDVASAA